MERERGADRESDRVRGRNRETKTEREREEETAGKTQRGIWIETKKERVSKAD